MKITNEIYYHVGTNQDGCKMLDSKHTHVFDSNFKNFRYIDIQNYRFINESNAYGKVGWLKYIDKIFENRDILILDESNFKQHFLQNVSYYSYKLNARYWELIFDRIRNQIDPNLPSRFSCIYLCKEDLEYWYDKAIAETGESILPVYKIKAHGNIHHADSKLLELDILPDSEIESIAKEYWNGNISQGGKLDEYLFWGQIEILKKFDKLDDVK